MTSVKLPFYAKFALALHGLLLFVLIIYLGQSIIIPLFFAFLIAILLYPLARFFEKIHLGRTFSAVLSVLVFICFIWLFIYFFTTQLSSFSKDLPTLQSRLMVQLAGIQKWVSLKFHIDTEQQMVYVSKAANNILAGVVAVIGHTFFNIVELLILVIFFFIFTFFILYFRRHLTKFLALLFSDAHKEKVYLVINNTRSLINHYVLGLLTEMIILVILTFIVLTILGIKYALLIAILAGALNIIPYLGIYTALVIGMLITLANGTGVQAGEVGIVFIILHFLDANILLPRIVGGRVKMNPFITIIAVLVGRLIWGIPGMFLFIPLTAMIKVISEQVDALHPWAQLIGEDEK